MNNVSDYTSTASEEVVRLLKCVAEEEGFTDYKIEIINTGSKGDGYLGIVTVVQIQNKDVENTKKVLNLVVKTASKSDALRKTAPIGSIYKREVYMYKTIFPTFHLLEIERGVSPSTFIPKFYKGEDEPRKEVLILENLKESGYKHNDRRLPMDADHVSLVLTEYGRLHALSFALKNHNPEHFKNLTESLDDRYVDMIKKTNYVEATADRCRAALQLLDANCDKQTVNTYAAFVEDVPQIIERLLQSVDNYSVVLHGDGWANNMLFGYQDCDGVPKPSEVRLLDFQLSRLGPPVLDLAYFLFSCSSKEIISKLDYYLKLYYDRLSSFLRKLGGNPDEMYPYSVFQQQWKKYARFGLMMALVLIHIMLSETDEAVDLSEVADSGGTFADAFNYEISNREAYDDRAKHIIMYCIDNNLI